VDKKRNLYFQEGFDKFLLDKLLDNLIQQAIGQYEPVGQTNILSSVGFAVPLGQ
jgi:hypothetical protein